MIEGMDAKRRSHCLTHWDGPISQPCKNEAEGTTRFATPSGCGTQAQPIAGTPWRRATSPTSRGIDLAAAAGDIETALRFHPRCPFGPGVRHPCLLALMRDGITNAPTGIHRIALTPEASRRRRSIAACSGARAR